MSKGKTRILQIIPAQPGYWALFGDGSDSIELSLPIVCYALTEEEKDDTQQIVAHVLNEYGDTEPASDPDNFIGIAYCPGPATPPNPVEAIVGAGEHRRLTDLRAAEEEHNPEPSAH